MKQINIIDQPFEGLLVLETKNLIDSRGAFQKVFTKDLYKELGLEPLISEIYYSKNFVGVIRGMHFQIPPYDHEKIVFVSNGAIRDVVLDIRKQSKTYGKYFSMNLSSKDGKFIYIPKGFAHGFLSLENDSIVNYAQTSCYRPDSDSGIKYDSFGFDWGIKKPIMSERDKQFVRFEEFKSPF